MHVQNKRSVENAQKAIRAFRRTSYIGALLILVFGLIVLGFSYHEEDDRQERERATSTQQKAQQTQGEKPHRHISSPPNAPAKRRFIPAGRILQYGNPDTFGLSYSGCRIIPDDTFVRDGTVVVWKATALPGEPSGARECFDVRGSFVVAEIKTAPAGKAWTYWENGVAEVFNENIYPDSGRSPRSQFFLESMEEIPLQVTIRMCKKRCE